MLANKEVSLAGPVCATLRYKAQICQNDLWLFQVAVSTGSSHMLTPCHGSGTVAGGSCTSQLTGHTSPGVSWLQKVAREGPGSCTRHLWQSRLQSKDEIWGSLSSGISVRVGCWGEERMEKGDYVHVMLNASDAEGEL